MEKETLPDLAAVEGQSLAEITAYLQHRMASTFAVLAVGVYAVHTQKKYKEKYKTVAAWAEAEFGWTRRQVYHYSDAGAVIKGLNCEQPFTKLEDLPTHEGQIRPLVRFKNDPQLLAGIWELATERADGKVTSREIEHALSQLEENGAVDLPPRPVQNTSQEPEDFQGWTAEEKRLLGELKKGRAVVIKMNTHKALQQYAQAKGLFVRIDRATQWGNPFRLNEDGDREHCLQAFTGCYWPNKPSLQRKLGLLKGKVLGCHCHPKPCHGHVLADLANNLK